MHTVKTFGSYIWQTYNFATFSSTSSNSNLFFLLNVHAGTSLKLTMMTALFQKAGAMVHVPQLSDWNHATVIDWRPLGYGLPRSFSPYAPYQFIFLFSLFLTAVYMAKDNPKFSFKGKDIYVIDLFIQTTEIAIDLASATSAVALILLGQPGMGCCALVFLIIQVRARTIQNAEPKETPLPAPCPERLRFFFSQQDHFWFAQFFGTLGGVISASDRKEGGSRLINGIFSLSISCSISKNWIKFIADKIMTHIEIINIKKEISKINKKMKTSNLTTQAFLKQKRSRLKKQLEELQKK